MIKKAASVLGYWTMRLKQLEDVRGFITGYDVFASLPTGSSKSLCFA
jgi:superfamily II DNA helicase RecQ